MSKKTMVTLACWMLALATSSAQTPPKARTVELEATLVQATL
jgi:hypothetical protein